MSHYCDGCPHDLTVVRKWKNGEYIGAVPISSLSNEDLLEEYASEVDGETRRISSDAPSCKNNLRTEILARMGRVLDPIVPKHENGSESEALSR